MTDDASNAALRLIQSNIAQSGHHIYLVSGGPSPRFAYTIGISQTTGSELILAGASFYSAEDVRRIINKIAVNLRMRGVKHLLNAKVDSLGVFSLSSVDPSWANALMLGALDFYSAREIPALQIVPDRMHETIDVPDLAQPWNATSEPAWQWLHEPWTYPIPPRSIATTNLDALRGMRVTEAARWEDDQWEMFAGSGPDVAREDVRVVPVGTLLAADSSLHAVTGLAVGQALWRDSTEVEWHQWDRKS